MKKTLYGLLAIVLAYLALSFGEIFTMRLVYGASKTLTQATANNILAIAGVLGIMGWLLIVFGTFFADDTPPLFRREAFLTSAFAVFSSVSLEFFLGAKLMPIARFGNYPWDWATPADAWLLIALVPIMLVAWGVFHVERRRYRHA